MRSSPRPSTPRRTLEAGFFGVRFGEAVGGPRAVWDVRHECWQPYLLGDLANDKSECRIPRCPWSNSCARACSWCRYELQHRRHDVPAVVGAAVTHDDYARWGRSWPWTEVPKRRTSERRAGHTKRTRRSQHGAKGRRCIGARIMAVELQSIGFRAGQLGREGPTRSQFGVPARPTAAFCCGRPERPLN
jgi:hypothetical protein